MMLVKVKKQDNFIIIGRYTGNIVFKVIVVDPYGLKKMEKEFSISLTLLDFFTIPVSELQIKIISLQYEIANL